MVFSHLIFIYAFLPLLLLLYFVRKDASWRRGVLLIFSLVFYAWGEPIYILLIIISAALPWMGVLMAVRSAAARRLKLRPLRSGR